MATNFIGGIFIHPVHIDQYLKSAFLTAEQPVDRSFAITLAMLFPEVLDKIGFQCLTNGSFYEIQILRQCFFAEYLQDEVTKRV